MIFVLLQSLHILDALFIVVWGKVGFAVTCLKFLMKYLGGDTFVGMDPVEFLSAVFSPVTVLLGSIPVGVCSLSRTLRVKSAKYTLLEKLSMAPFLSSFTTFEMHYVGSFTAPYNTPVFDEGSLRQYGIEAQLEEDLKAGQLKNLMYVLLAAALVLFLYSGPVYVLLIPLFIVIHWAILAPYEGSDWSYESLKVDKFAGSDGLYRVVKSFFGYHTQRGVATVSKGIVQTRLHVVDGRPSDIFFQGLRLRPTMYNERLDIISWCGTATYITPEDGQQVIVEILPTFSDAPILYSSECMKLQSGVVVFKGITTLGGASGSPYFVKTDVVDPTTGLSTQEIQFAGNIGTNFTNDYSEKFGQEKWQVEMLRSGGRTYPKNVMEISPGGNYQIFDHPGSGKTRMDIPVMVREGLAFCPNIIIAGPTRVVAKEIFNSLNSSNLLVSLNIRGSLHRRRTARVVVTTHSSLLRMIMNNDYLLKPGSGIVLDEAHFDNPHTKMLLGYFRNLYASGRDHGFYVEMTATGFDFVKKETVINKGSRYHIEDIAFDDFDKTIDEVVHDFAGKRILIFSPQVTGGSNTVEGIVKRLLRREVPHKIVPMYRAVYEQAVLKIAQEYPQGLIIVSTSISECGANFDVDVVVDTCRRLAYVQNDPQIPIYRMQEVPVRLSQLIQRRGRTGRRRPGFYYYPVRFDWTDMNEERVFAEAEDEDEDVFLEHMMFKNKYGSVPSTGVSLSRAQLIAWLKGDNKRASSARTVKLFYRTNGTLYTRDQIYENIRRNLLSDQGKDIQIGGGVVRVSWWDDRDASILCKYLSQMKMCQRRPVNRLWTKLVTYDEYRPRAFVYEQAAGDFDNRHEILLEGIPMLRRLLPSYLEDNPQDEID